MRNKLAKAIRATVKHRSNTVVEREYIRDSRTGSIVLSPRCRRSEYKHIKKFVSKIRRNGGKV